MRREKRVGTREKNIIGEASRLTLRKWEETVLLAPPTYEEVSVVFALTPRNQFISNQRENGDRQGWRVGEGNGKGRERRGEGGSEQEDIKNNPVCNGV